MRTPPDSVVALLADLVVPQAVRAHALIDDNPLSATFGCADRAYWYYRTLTNFPGATWQQLMLGFAALYRTPHPSNPHHLNPLTAELAGAALKWWAGAQHRDGAFDEWYLNEHSYCPTAITGAGAALTLHLMGDELPKEAVSAGIAALEQAGRWLEPRYHDDVMNQNLAAATTLQGLAHVLRSDRWHRVATTKLERIRADQSTEGWFPEYTGMDLGYSALALDLLAACSMLGGGPVADEMARDLCRFLIEVQGAGLAPPGRLGSRGTCHAFPFGALYFADTDSNAAALAARWLAGLARRMMPRPEAVDDRYFAYFYLPQFALAFYRAATSATPAEPATARLGATDLPKCGFVVVRRADWSVSVSRRLGGALAVETDDDLPLYHLGYEVTTAEGRRYSSVTWDLEEHWSQSVEGQAIKVVARFRSTSAGVPLRRLMVPFQIVAHALKSSRIAAVFQGFVKRKMVAPKHGLPLRLERRIEVEAQNVRVQDTLIPEPGLGRLSNVQVATAISMHSPSARQEPARTVTLACGMSQQLMDSLNANKPATLVFVLASSGWEEIRDARS